MTRVESCSNVPLADTFRKRFQAYFVPESYRIWIDRKIFQGFFKNSKKKKKMKLGSLSGTNEEN
jgi:hypothetical protein